MIKKDIIISLGIISLIFCNVNQCIAQITQIKYVATWGGFNEPSGVDVDQHGNVYVADTNNNRIQVFTSDGTFIRQWGSYGGNPGQFNCPNDLAVDNNGNVYVTDGFYTNSHWWVQVFTNNGNFIRYWDGDFGIPFGIDINDSTGHVYVADLGYDNIKVFSNTGILLMQWDICPSSDCFLFGLEIDQTNGDVYVAGEVSNEVGVFSQEGTLKRIITGQFSGPYDIAFDQRGYVFISNDLAGTVQVYTKDGNFITEFGGFSGPGGIAINKNNRVYIADYDNNVIYVYDIIYDTVSVDIAYFKARPQGDNLLLKWAVNEDKNLAGWNLYRSENSDSGFEKINVTIIPGHNTSSGFRYRDTTFKQKKPYFYQLEYIELDGKTKMGQKIQIQTTKNIASSNPAPSILP